MEEKGEINFGVTVKGDEAPESYRISLRGENPPQFGGPTMLAAALPTAVAAPPSVAAVSTVSMAVPSTEVIPMKKKRGRPRKYGPDGKVTTPLSPMPISSSVPLTGEFSAWKSGRGKPLGSIKKAHKFEFGNSGEKIAYFGANFTPHIITVNAGEDVTMKVMSFSQQGSRAICILSANGTISNVTLRQPTSSGGTLTYEGRFEILSLSGSFMPTENGGTKSRSGGMSVSLAGPDGRVVGGGLAGFLVAAGPVQVVVGSFLPGLQQEHKPKKQRVEHAAPVTPITANPLFGEETRATYGGIKPFHTSPTFQRNNSVSSNLVQDFKILAADNKTSLPGEISKDLSQSNCEVSC